MLHAVPQLSPPRSLPRYLRLYEPMTIFFRCSFSLPPHHCQTQEGRTAAACFRITTSTLENSLLSRFWPLFLCVSAVSKLSIVNCQLSTICSYFRPLRAWFYLLDSISCTRALARENSFCSLAVSTHRSAWLHARFIRIL